eukprot:1418776-Pyramimonas_sp.AAC.1
MSSGVVKLRTPKGPQHRVQTESQGCSRGVGVAGRGVCVDVRGVCMDAVFSLSYTLESACRLVPEPGNSALR